MYAMADLDRRHRDDSEVGSVIETEFLGHRLWTSKAKWASAEIETSDSRLASVVGGYLNAQGRRQQREAFRALTAYVLEWSGGELRELWARPTEVVPDGKQGA